MVLLILAKLEIDAEIEQHSKLGACDLLLDHDALADLVLPRV